MKVFVRHETFPTHYIPYTYAIESHGGGRPRVNVKNELICVPPLIGRAIVGVLECVLILDASVHLSVKAMLMHQRSGRRLRCFFLHLLPHFVAHVFNYDFYRENCPSSQVLHAMCCSEARRPKVRLFTAVGRQIANCQLPCQLRTCG